MRRSRLGSAQSALALTYTIFRADHKKKTALKPVTWGIKYISMARHRPSHQLDIQQTRVVLHALF